MEKTEYYLLHNIQCVEEESKKIQIENYERDLTHQHYIKHDLLTTMEK